MLPVEEEARLFGQGYHLVLMRLEHADDGVDQAGIVLVAVVSSVAVGLSPVSSLLVPLVSFLPLLLSLAISFTLSKVHDCLS